MDGQGLQENVYDVLLFDRTNKTDVVGLSQVAQLSDGPEAKCSLHV